MKKIKFILLTIVLSIFISGCGVNAQENDEIKEEIIEEVQEEVQEEVIEEKEIINQDNLIEIALNELGYEGGEKFWSWAGFSNHAAWCACFVSWCANECGFIEKGIIPKFTVCQDAVNWFKEKGQWLSKGNTPEPGMLIFFDYNHCDYANHVGIVHEVKDGYIYSIEGNSHDKVRENPYLIDYEDIMGYGTLNYER